MENEIFIVNVLVLDDMEKNVLKIIDMKELGNRNICFRIWNIYFKFFGIFKYKVVKIMCKFY